MVSHNYWPRPTKDDVDLILSKLPNKYRKIYDRVSIYYPVNKHLFHSLITGVFLEKSLKIVKTGIDQEKSYIQKSHLFTGKVSFKMLHVKTGIFLEKSYTREHRNFKLIYIYQVFSRRSHTLKSQIFFLEKSHTHIHSQQYNNVNSFLH